MTNPIHEAPRFLGRHYDDATNTWVCSDGTGRVPDEMRIDLNNAVEQRIPGYGNGLFVLITLWGWKDRLGNIQREIKP